MQPGGEIVTIRIGDCADVNAVKASLGLPAAALLLQEAAQCLRLSAQQMFEYGATAELFVGVWRDRIAVFTIVGRTPKCTLYRSAHRATSLTYWPGRAVAWLENTPAAVHFRMERGLQSNPQQGNKTHT